MGGYRDDDEDENSIQFQKGGRQLRWCGCRVAIPWVGAVLGPDAISKAQPSGRVPPVATSCRLERGQQQPERKRKGDQPTEFPEAVHGRMIELAAEVVKPQVEGDPAEIAKRREAQGSVLFEYRPVFQGNVREESAEQDEVLHVPHPVESEESQEQSEGRQREGDAVSTAIPEHGEHGAQRARSGVNPD